MTTYTFNPSQLNPFQFQPTLDGQVYTVIVTWNVFGQRYYFSVYSLSGTLIVNAALAGSPLDYDLNLVKGYFTTSTLVFREANQQFEVTP